MKYETLGKIAIVIIILGIIIIMIVSRDVRKTILSIDINDGGEGNSLPREMVDKQKNIGGGYTIILDKLIIETNFNGISWDTLVTVSYTLPTKNDEQRRLISYSSYRRDYIPQSNYHAEIKGFVRRCKRIEKNLWGIQLIFPNEWKTAEIFFATTSAEEAESILKLIPRSN